MLVSNMLAIAAHLPPCIHSDKITRQQLIKILARRSDQCVERYQLTTEICHIRRVLS